MRSAELVRVAQTIACCGEIGGVAGRCEITKGRVWPLLVVIGDPTRDPGAGVVETKEQAFVEKLVAHSTIEALAEPVLHRLAGGDEVPGDLVFL